MTRPATSSPSDSHNREYVPEEEESIEEAAHTLFDTSQVTLQALSHGLSPFRVRCILLAHIAGAPQPQRTAHAEKDPFAPLLSQAETTAQGSSGGAVVSLPKSAATSAAHATRLHRLHNDDHRGPVVAYIRRPRRHHAGRDASKSG